tara:strand:+ start:346 stop:513 length:168 start_codon:yes stop_codon:yes gene_type:complete
MIFIFEIMGLIVNVPLTSKKKINISREQLKFNNAVRRAVPGGSTETHMWPKNAII